MSNEYSETRVGDSSISREPRVAEVRLRGSHVPRNIGWIEPWIGAGLALFTAFMALVAFPDRPVLWVFVAAAAALAVWSWRQPARRQGALLLRAVLFAVLAAVLLSLPRLDAAGNGALLFYWITMPMLLYAFLLRPRLGALVLAVNLAGYAVSVLLASTPMVLAAVLLRVVYLLVFSAAAIRMGAVLRRTDELLEQRRVDAATGMFNEYGLLDHGSDIWDRCRQAGTPATLVFIDVPDIRKLQEIYGNAVARSVGASVSDVIARLETGKNVVARLSLSRFAMLVPDATGEQAWNLVTDKLGMPPQLDLSDDGFEMTFPLGVHVVENRLQGIPFAKFYESERDALDSSAVGARNPPAQAAARKKDDPGREGPATTQPMEFGT